ncbi:putative membrane protein [Burkholderia thailandensis E254]|uniref:hypothetical protein n=1 Tax=Burkholderia thailandensis TaxID=57975 RepID=UPI000517B37F|nr:hypothetical protein [Burkholderia thailandensis]AIT21085.1 putative membrane protein [Burkholderia thailandensis E254]PNE69136.1 hypothetical protein A8H38_24480 [Burkholderia thailandensis]
MKLRLTVAVLAALVLCYVAAGTPSIGLLFKPSVIGEGLALKPITYHWANRLDRAIPEAELLASRFYVLVLAVVSLAASGLVLRGSRDGKGFAFVLGWSVALLVILLYAQTQAFYTVG